jgi:hypothetical protein
MTTLARCRILATALVMGTSGLGCGLGSVPLGDQGGLIYNEPNIGIAHTDMDYAESDYHADGFDPDYEWYIAVLYNVRDGDRRTDQEILFQSIQQTKARYHGEIDQQIKQWRGKVEYAEFFVFRDTPHGSKRIGTFTSGLIVSLEDLFDATKTADALFAESALYDRPVVDNPKYHGWYHRMVIDHFEGRFDHKRQSAEPAP